jgi:hypothetical protein
MRIHRGLLFWGLFLIPLGAIPLLARANAIDLPAVGSASRFWPLILVAIGLALVLGRGRGSVVATAVLALVLGTIGGLALASGPGVVAMALDCGSDRATDAQVDRNGTFSEPAELNLDLRCGSVDVTTGSGSAWSVHAAYSGVTPRVEASANALDVTVPANAGAHRQNWSVTVPTDQTDAIKLKTNAGRATLQLEGAHLNRIEADMNAGDLLINGGSASIGRLDVQMNAGRVRITLDDSVPVTGEVSLNASVVDLCVPAGAELRLTTNDQLTFVNNLSERGLTKAGNVWHRAGTAGAPAIELAIEGNAGSLTLDPDGGCT